MLGKFYLPAPVKSTFNQGQEYSFPWVSWGNKEKGWIWGQGQSVKGTYAVAVYLGKLEIFEDRFVID